MRLFFCIVGQTYSDYVKDSKKGKLWLCDRDYEQIEVEIGELVEYHNVSTSFGSLAHAVIMK